LQLADYTDDVVFGSLSGEERPKRAVRADDVWLHVNGDDGRAGRAQFHDSSSQSSVASGV
jgi:hypothetical protein